MAKTIEDTAQEMLHDELNKMTFDDALELLGESHDEILADLIERNYKMVGMDYIRQKLTQAVKCNNKEER